MARFLAFAACWAALSVVTALMVAMPPVTSRKLLTEADGAPTVPEPTTSCPSGVSVGPCSSESAELLIETKSGPFGSNTTSILACNCTLDFQPVCGSNSQSYFNECFLKCDGVPLQYAGQCTADFPLSPVSPVNATTPSPGDNVTGTIYPLPTPVCSCPAIYLPVCGADNRTYVSECTLACAGVSLAFDGPCDGRV